MSVIEIALHLDQHPAGPGRQRESIEALIRELGLVDVVRLPARTRTDAIFGKFSYDSDGITATFVLSVLLFVVMVLWKPEGIAGIWQAAMQARRLRRERPAPAGSRRGRRRCPDNTRNSRNRSERHAVADALRGETARRQLCG